MAQRGWSTANSCYRSGSFATYVTVGANVTMAAPWVFGSGLNNLWGVGGFTYNLTTSTINLQANGFLGVSGTGTISGTGFTPTGGTWSFTTQNPRANGIFSFSASTQRLLSIANSIESTVFQLK